MVRQCHPWHVPVLSLHLPKLLCRSCLALQPWTGFCEGLDTQLHSTPQLKLWILPFPPMPTSGSNQLTNQQTNEPPTHQATTRRRASPTPTVSPKEQRQRICAQPTEHAQAREGEPVLLPLVEMETFCEEQKLLLSLEEEVPSPGDPRLLCILADVCEVQLFSLEVISEAHKVKVGGDIDECVGHDGIPVLRQNLVYEKVKPD